LIFNLYHHIEIILVIGNLKSIETYFKNYYKNIRLKEIEG